MNKKTVSIALPRIEGVELKNATVDLENGVVVAEYGERKLSLKVKKGDVIYQNSPFFRNPMIIIVSADATIIDGVNNVGTCIAMIGSNQGIYFKDNSFGTHNITELRFATESEKQTLFDALKKEGKRYNPKTFRIEDIEKDISEIAVNYRSSVDYLLEDLHQHAFLTTKKHRPKLDAFNQLIILAEAWNTFDEFKPYWDDLEQKRYYPLFRSDRDIINFSHTAKLRVSLDTHTSNFAFKSKERAEQFGKQFIDLFRIVLTN